MAGTFYANDSRNLSSMLVRTSNVANARSVHYLCSALAAIIMGHPLGNDLELELLALKDRYLVELLALNLRMLLSGIVTWLALPN